MNVNMAYFRDDTLDQAHDCTACLFNDPAQSLVGRKSRKDSLMCDVRRYEHSIRFFSTCRLGLFHRQKKTYFYHHLLEQYRKGKF